MKKNKENSTIQKKKKQYMNTVFEQQKKAQTLEKMAFLKQGQEIAMIV